MMAWSRRTWSLASSATLRGCLNLLNSMVFPDMPSDQRLSILLLRIEHDRKREQRKAKKSVATGIDEQTISS